MAASLAVMRVLQREAGLDLAQACRPGRRPFARRIYRAMRSRRVRAGRCCAASQDARARDARCGACGRRRDERAARHRNLAEAEAAAAEAAAQGGVCVVANDNAPGQVVISGTKATVERAGEIAKTKGAKRAMMLTVSAPFHCPLMQPAADAMREALARSRSARPRSPVVANVTAAEIKRARNHPPASRGTGDRPRALARKRAARSARSASTPPWNSAATRC